MSANTESADNEQAMASYSKDFANALTTAYDWRKTNFPGRFTNIYARVIFTRAWGCRWAPVQRRSLAATCTLRRSGRIVRGNSWHLDGNALAVWQRSLGFADRNRRRSSLASAECPRSSTG